MCVADGTDKSHDDHKYTDLYASLFDPIRDRVLNVTEIGIAMGQSLQVRSRAHAWGRDKLVGFECGRCLGGCLGCAYCLHYLKSGRSMG